MSDRFADRRAVRDKVEWEGGIMAALEWGIKSTDMPEGDNELDEAWDRLADAYQQLLPLAGAVQELLDTVGDDEDAES